MCCLGLPHIVLRASPAAIYRSAQGPRSEGSPKGFGVLLGVWPESAPKSTPKSVFFAFGSTKSAEKHSLFLKLRARRPNALKLISEPPIWPDLFRFPRFLPICSELRSMFSGIPRFVPICSDLLRFLPICSDLFSEQIRTDQGNPFLPTPFANP